MDWEAAVQQCEEILELCDQIPPEGEEFATSVSEKVTSMRDSIKGRKSLTEKMQKALDNMLRGATNWAAKGKAEGSTKDESAPF